MEVAVRLLLLVARPGPWLLPVAARARRIQRLRFEWPYQVSRSSARVSPRRVQTDFANEKRLPWNDPSPPRM